MSIEGHRAKAILEDPTVTEVLELIEVTLHEQWGLSPTAEQREEIWYTLQGLRRFKSTLDVAVQNAIMDKTLERDT